MATIHLIEGPVGAGKSTFAAQLGLKYAAPLLNLDEWMVTLFRPDRPETDFMQWYTERKSRCIEQIWCVTCNLMETLLEKETNVILELGLVQLNDREAFYNRIDGTDYDLEVYVLEAAKEVRRQRVRDRNIERGTTFQMEVADDIFEIADRAWQTPDEREYRDRDIQMVSTN